MAAHFPRSLCRWLAAAACALPLLLGAQEAKHQATPFSVLLNLETLGTSRAIAQPLPIWLDSVTRVSVPDVRGHVARTIFRLRFRKMGDLHSEVFLRVFYDDVKGFAPLIRGLSNRAVPYYLHGPFGAGLDLPNSETVAIPMEGIETIEIEAPGDGLNVRGAFVASLKKSEMWHGLDFAPDSELLDPFRNPPPSVPDASDLYLYDRVRAPIDPLVVKLVPREMPGSTWEFELGALPLFAVITFDVLNVDALAPPELEVNGRPVGPASIALPDLADPGYRGVVRARDIDVRFRYAGWLRCQRAVPASALVEGLNRIEVILSKESGPIAVRAFELHLKNP